MSFLSQLFKSEPDPREALQPLWRRVVAEARDLEWYRSRGVADTLEGRFDMVSLVLSLVMLRMEREEALCARTALLTELFVEDMEGQLREQGVGDPVVGKHMGRLMSSLGGRIAAYRKGFADGGGVLEDAVLRNVELSDEHKSGDVAIGARTLADRLDATPADVLLKGEIA